MGFVLRIIYVVFLIRLRSLILLKNCGPKFVVLSKIFVVHKVLFLVTIGSNSICLNYIEHCVMSLPESEVMK